MCTTFSNGFFFYARMSLFFVELGDEDIFFGAVRRGLDFLCLGFVSTFCSGTQRCIGTSLRGLILLLCCFAVAPADHAGVPAACVSCIKFHRCTRALRSLFLKVSRMLPGSD